MGADDDVRALVDSATLVATSVVAYTEARSAFARRARAGILSRPEHSRVKTDFERDWSAFVALDVTQTVARHAADLAELHALRALEALHLASYHAAAAAMPEEAVRFSSFDDRLTAAAAAGEPSS